MIFSSTIDTLTEDELSVLFYICHRVFEPIGLEATLQFVKMLRIDITCKIIDVLQAQALDDKKEIFSSLRKKLTE